MYFDPNPNALDVFLATVRGKRIVGVSSIAIGLVFLLISRTVVVRKMEHSRKDKDQDVVGKYENLIRRDALLFLGSVALILGAFYFVWSLCPVQ